MANVYRIEYETEDFDYKVHIVADTFENARSFLFKNLKKKFKINSMSELCRLDVVTKEAIPQLIIEKDNKPTINSNPVGQESTWKCPWCGEVFEKEMGLKIHIGKQHK